MKFGIERLLSEPDLRAPLQGRRVALLGHPASVTADLSHSLDVLAACAHVLSTPDDDLWTYKGATGGSIADALAWMTPYIADKSTWPKPPDVEAWAGWPVRHPSLLFGGLALGRMGYVDLWKRLDPDPTDAEIIRNYPLRQPVLWV